VENERVLVGQIAGAFGIRGEVRFAPLLETPETLASLLFVELRFPGGRAELRKITGVRRHHGGVLLTFEGTDRTEVERLRGAEVWILKSELPPLGPDAWYEWQLLGLKVATESGQELGTIEQVHYYPANDVYETEIALIPAIADVLVRVDLDRGEMLVRDLPGLRKDEL
jgi:16S rRNA processing protein RimM